MKEEIKKFFKGEVADDATTLDSYSRDASLFKVRPKLVVYPEDNNDLENLVKYVNEYKALDSTLSITIRAAGSDMTGGPLNDSIIADVSRHLNKMGEVKEGGTTVEPGLYYRDFEKKALEKNVLLPCYPASKNICALGGMINNNCGGEKTLRYGKMENFIVESKWILADGKEYEIKPLSQTELDLKMRQEDFEGNLYKQIYNLLESNKQIIREAKPNVSKNSAGYYLWNIYNGETFDLNKLLVGSQGTLGIMTEATVRLVPIKKHHDMVALFFKSWDELPGVVNVLLPYEPESLETFDEDTLKLGIRFMPEIARKADTNFLSFASKFLPEAFIGVRMLGLPKLVVLVEMVGESEEEVRLKVQKVEEIIKHFKVWHRVIRKDSEEEKFWIMRRESFNLLREHVGNKKTAPFVEDFCIRVEDVPEFLPKVKKILEERGIDVNIAGHAGNGNFHIIPLMDMKNPKNIQVIKEVGEKVYSLVSEYHGSITGEHNDGIVRTPYLGKMYSPTVLNLFQKTKDIFDPQNIFNPGKKVPSTSSGQARGTLEYLESHIDSGTHS